MNLLIHERVPVPQIVLLTLSVRQEARDLGLLHSAAPKEMLTFSVIVQQTFTSNEKDKVIIQPEKKTFFQQMNDEISPSLGRAAT